MTPETMWWNLSKDDNIASAVWTQVRRMEMAQADIFQRLHRLEVLYDPNTPLSIGDDDDGRRGGVHENIIASNVDTLAATIATADVRARVMTDAADWRQQRTARDLELYAEEQNKKLGVLQKCRSAFKEGAKKGKGLVKVRERFGKPCVEHVLVENVVTDPNETYAGEALQMHEWVSVDADELAAEYPDQKDAIYAARGQRQPWRIDNRYVPFQSNRVMYLDSYRLPIGEKGEPGYRPGRHTKTLMQVVLLDEEYEDDFFPYGEQDWSERAHSWYPISGAERAAGIQRALNKRNWHIEKQNDNIALPTTYVRPADANMTVKTTRVGAMAVCKGDYPHTVTPNAVSPETYQSRVDLKASGSQEFGLSPMATHGTKPAGLDSGIALREFKDQTSDRYSPQEKDFEDLVLQVTGLVLLVCKRLGDKAPTMIRQGRFGKRRLRWKDVDMGDVKVQLYAASNLPRTPAGRMQFVIELAQAGVISQDSARRLMEHPDVESELSLYTAALESAEGCFDDIALGHRVTVEPFMNFAMCAWRGQMEYLKWQRSGNCPEAKLEALRTFVVTAAWMKSQASNANAAPQPGALPGAQPMAGAAGPPPGAMPPLPGPDMSTPTAALAPTAMNLVAGHAA